MFQPISPEFKKEMANAHYEYCLRHRWGNPNNAGKNYVPKKKKKKSTEGL
ncbi:MAG: hypothetical protein GY714_01530 [Desulfobacterales bacterium]|nr:hypothetical protein [Desulfobacterales bacterium]